MIGLTEDNDANDINIQFLEYQISGKYSNNIAMPEDGGIYIVDDAIWFFSEENDKKTNLSQSDEQHINKMLGGVHISGK